MDQLKWRTPSKIKKCDGSLMNSSRLYTTPVKQNEIRPKRTAYQNNARCFTVLPSYITPPSGLAKVIRRNPFEADLASRLHLPMISPTVFAKIPDALPQQSPGFKWSIDELAHIHPAKIEESPIQQIYSPDPEVELKAQAAIDRFFKENQIIPSPWQVKEKINKSYIDMEIPCKFIDDMNSTKELLKLKKEAWTQTVLSLPVNLPQNIEDTLKSFCTFTQEQNTDNEDINSSNNSLRRKLFFNHEGTDNDNESIASLSSVEMSGSMVLSNSPPQSGMFIHGSLKGSLKSRRHSDRSISLSPPCMSPIHNENGMLGKKMRRRSRSITRLDYAKNMSIDIEEHRNLHDNLLGISRDTNIEGMEDDRKITIINNGKTNLCDSASIEISKYINPISDTIQLNSIVSNNKDPDTISLTTVTEIDKNSTCISNSVQDTGYQTYSMNSTMHTVDGYNISMQNHKVQPEEQTIMFKDNTQLSWKENLRNVFSSTPSKYKKEKES